MAFSFSQIKIYTTVDKEKIFEILISEGVDIPETGQMRVLEPFMARFGYIDDNGWWIRQ